MAMAPSFGSFGRSHLHRWWLAAGLLGGLAAMPAVAQQTQAPPTQAPPTQTPPTSTKPATPPAAPVDPAKRDALAKQLTTVLNNAGTTSANTIEAQLTFQVSQAGASCSTALAALAQVQALAKTAAAKTAVDNAIAAARKCEANGTGGLAERQQTLQNGTTLGLPGGTSNYQLP